MAVLQNVPCSSTVTQRHSSGYWTSTGASHNAQSVVRKHCSRDDDYKETMPRRSEEYLQRELDFYQLPSLDTLGLSSKFCVKSFSAEAASKELVQEIVHEIKEKGLQNMFPWCVYIYDKVSLDDLKLQRRILVIPDAVRHARPSDLLSYIKEKEHKEFIATALSSKLYLGQKSRCLFRVTDEATFTL